jgi:hypothetical protein
MGTEMSERSDDGSHHGPSNRRGDLRWDAVGRSRQPTPLDDLIELATDTTAIPISEWETIYTK